MPPPPPHPRNPKTAVKKAAGTAHGSARAPARQAENADAIPMSSSQAGGETASGDGVRGSRTPVRRTSRQTKPKQRVPVPPPVGTKARGTKAGGTRCDGRASDDGGAAHRNKRGVHDGGWWALSSDEKIEYLKSRGHNP